MAETVASQQETAIVTGGSRGLGRGIVEALAARQMRVIAVARGAASLEAAAKEMRVEHVAADVADELTAGRLMQDLRPDLIVLCAGASALLRPLHQHSWETFSQNWEVDTKATFVWLRNALLLPMKPGSHIVIVSSMAAVNGSPLSGSYAGAKRMQWMMADYASQEASRLKLGLRFHCLLPVLNPSTDLGRAAIAAYAERAGISVEHFTERLMPALTPAIIGEAVVDLHQNPGKWDHLAHRIGGDGLVPLS
jgi:NAD(P)-dependent dehydrogenase (short-subunit alcohol dehydrogenase family)